MDTPTPLIIPFIEKLDADNLAEAAKVLQDNGSPTSIDSVNWKDQYPYHPLTSFYIGHNGKYIFIDFFVRCN